MVVSSLPVIGVGLITIVCANAIGAIVLIPTLPIYYIVTGKWIPLEKFHLADYLDRKYDIISRVFSFVESA